MSVSHLQPLQWGLFICWTAKLSSTRTSCWAPAGHWQHSGTVSSLARGKSRSASLEDLLYPLWKITAFLTETKETALSHTSWPESPASSWPSTADRIFSAVREHFLSKVKILQNLSNTKAEKQTSGKWRYIQLILLVKRKMKRGGFFWSLHCFLVPHCEQSSRSASLLRDTFPVMNLAQSCPLYIPVSTFPIDF